ncbi:hypothetical protein F895_00168 [Acinetobacter sp. CIP 64.2]|uniref:hypothetical protein n=2 Tax=Acinetobacter TaxID=469 RepID=UPI0002CFC65C|nr:MULTISPECIES: hypothetical protein [unclassified Acinetobacter]ENX18100.1 hypothetical protein F895_00168 [Acinetobacter sp. CIP 64.2]
MQKIYIKNTLSSIVIALMLSACGGGGNDSPVTENKPTSPTTTNSISFPASQFTLDVDEDKQFFIVETQLSNRNNSLTTQSNVIFQQQSSHPQIDRGDYQYILTKDKLYYNQDGNHAINLVENKNNSITIGYENNGQGLTTTINYKIIPLANQAVTSAAVTHQLFDQSDAIDSNYLNLKTAFQKSSTTFNKNAECYQYLNSKNNQETISFDDNFTVNQTLEQWIADKQSNNFTVKQETWAGYRVAFVMEQDDPKNAHDHLVVEINHQLYFAYYDGTQVNDHSISDSDPQIFKDGICDLYNASATDLLKTVIQGLPRL